MSIDVTGRPPTPTTRGRIRTTGSAPSSLSIRTTWFPATGSSVAIPTRSSAARSSATTTRLGRT